MKTFTVEQKKAIKRICSDFDFEDVKELRSYLRDSYGDIFDADWFSGKTESECYSELERVLMY